ncbi:transglutaminase-like cysteine peptidase [Oricola sp.]|uniref:transglutaminase-like cysteine peptidase n=1 Tax=Oricola sp. TaxID=1979950 RepID=UPI003BAB9AAD
MKSFLLVSVLMASSAFPLNAGATTWLKTGGATSKPYGHVAYCRGRASDCRAHGGSGRLAPNRMSVLQAVNSSVNRSIKPVSDLQLHGKREVWSFPASAGDCEEYALSKRAALLRRGYRPGDLLIAVGNKRGERHAVLVVRTSEGDFVLDNMEDSVLPVRKAGMRFSKIQSPVDAGNWVRVTGKTRNPAAIFK